MGATARTTTRSRKTASAPRRSRAAPKRRQPAPPRQRGPKAGDYVGIAIAYAREAVADRKGAKFGKWVRLAASRFLKDLERAKKRSAPFRFDEWHACDPCDFIEKLPHIEGEWETPTIKLHPSHVFFLVQLFGFRKPNGARRFTTALFAVARKNAKSTLAAAILLYCELCEPENGPQVVTAATTGSQARIVFNIAKAMVERTPDLRRAFNAQAWANAISCGANGGTMKPINAKASTQDGLNPSAVGLDEIHAHKTHDLLNVLKSAAGARRNPLFLFTTTEGYETPGPWPEMRSFARNLLQGVFEADHYLVVMFALDDPEREGEKGDDDFDESRWIKANPLIDVNPLLEDEIRKEAIEAKAMPGRLAEFRIKRLNRPSSVATGWINLVRWIKCDGPLPLELLRTTPCFAALDLASTTDMTALALVWRIAGVWYVLLRYWVPRGAVAQRTERGTAPYAAWELGGHLVVTDGDVTDYEVIERDINALREEFQIQKIAFDPWNASAVTNRLMKANAPMLQFRQGGQSYNPPMRELERAYTAGQFAHAGNPVLRWNAANVVKATDKNLNWSPDRKKSNEKIDGMCALLMAMGALLVDVPKEPAVTVL